MVGGRAQVQPVNVYIRCVNIPALKSLSKLVQIVHKLNEDIADIIFGHV